MRNPFRYLYGLPEVIRLAVMMYVRHPPSLRQVWDLMFERASILATSRFGAGGTGSDRCLRLRFQNDASIIGRFRNGAGTWTGCSTGSMARRITSGVR